MAEQNSARGKYWVVEKSEERPIILGKGEAGRTPVTIMARFKQACEKYGNKVPFEEFLLKV
jgi:hypothetical protein